ncbi:MAG: hypothetical protein WCI50_10555 [Actinomycetes bacterium]
MTLASVPTAPTLSEVKVPEIVTMIPVADAEALLEAARRELEALEREADAVKAQAEAVERALGVSSDDEMITWMSVRLHRFLDEVRREAEADAVTLIEAVQSQHFRNGRTLAWDHLFVREPAVPVPGPGSPEAVVELVVDPVVELVVDPVVEPVVDPVVVASEPVAVEPVVIERTAPEPVHDAESEPVDEPARSLEREFWSDDAGPARRGSALRRGRSMALQIGALLFVLAAVLVRIG